MMIDSRELKKSLKGEIIERRKVEGKKDTQN